jgi:hypothetical protein
VKAYHINVFRAGYYQGLGYRQWASNIIPSVSLPQTQPACQVNPGGQTTGRGRSPPTLSLECTSPSS